MSEHSSTNSNADIAEPSSGTELSDVNLVRRDMMELQEQSSITIDSSAEREAAENPLLPAQIRAANAALDALQPVEQPAYLKRLTDNENIADKLQHVLESNDESSTSKNQLQDLPELEYNLAAVKPVSDEVFKQHLFEFSKTQNAAQISPIRTKFVYFLKTYHSVYEEADYIYELKQNIEESKTSITVSLDELADYSPVFAEAVLSEPLKFYDVLQESLQYFIRDIEKNAPLFQLLLNYQGKIFNSFVSEQINKVSTMRCQIISASRQFVQLDKVSIQCLTCNNILGLYDAGALPKKCDCGGTKFRLYPQGCLYSSYINIIMQMGDGEKRSGVVYGELAGDLKPGVSVDLTGVWRILDVKKAICKVYFQVYGAIIQNFQETFSTEDLQAFEVLSQKLKSSDLDNIFINSIFPQIYGHQLAKQMILASLLSGTAHAGTRENIHLLLIGDPGTAKSQFLKQLQQYVSKYTYSQGKGSSAAGLTVSVVKRGGEFQLQAGQMVLSNNGVCCIDELDKMNQVDVVSLHQAMEQQEVSITKAGIIATLPAKCSVIAACNPVGQIYNANLPLTNNVNIGEALLSRFDLVYICEDTHESDRLIADFIVKKHSNQKEEVNYARKQLERRNLLQQAEINEYERIIQEAGDFQRELPEDSTATFVVQEVLQLYNNQDFEIILPCSFIKSYLQNARLTQPLVPEAVAQKLTDFYVKIREITNKYQAQVTAREFSCLLRLTEARAKLHFRKVAIQEDADFACELFGRQLAGELKGGFQRKAEIEILELIRRFEDIAAGVLSRCFEALEIFNANSEKKEKRVSIYYLQEECQKAGIELNQEFLTSKAFSEKYKARYDDKGEIVEIEM